MINTVDAEQLGYPVVSLPTENYTNGPTDRSGRMPVLAVGDEGIASPGGNVATANEQAPWSGNAPTPGNAPGVDSRGVPSLSDILGRSDSLGHAGLPFSARSASPNAVAYRPDPLLDGCLQVDPEISLPSPGINVDIAYYFNSNDPYNGPYGYGRTISPNLRLQAWGNGPVVTITRGNGAIVSYQFQSGVGYIPMTNGLVNTLVYDSTNSQWRETTTDGITSVYPGGHDELLYQQVVSIAYAEDSVGNRHTFSYYQGRLATLKDAVGRLVSFNYNSGILESIEDWAGRRTSFAYDNSSIPGKPLLTTVTGPSGCQTGYGYDNHARLVKVVDPNGYATTYAYNPAGQISQRTAVHDGKPATTRYDYYADPSSPGYQSVVTNPDGGVVTHTLDQQWNVGMVEDSTGASWVIDRNSHGQEVSRRDAYGAITTTLYYGSGLHQGLPQAVMNPLGYVTTFLRGDFDNVSTIEHPNPGGELIVERFGWAYPDSTFDTTGLKRRLQYYSDPMSRLTTYLYNGRGQVTAVINPLSQITSFNYDAFGNQESVMNPLGYLTTTVYDAAGRVQAIVDPLNHRTSYTYDPQDRVTEVMDPLGYITSTGYDSLGNVKVTIDALNRRTSYTYNIFDQPTLVQDPLGHYTSYTYDQQGRQVSATDPLGHTTSTSYDTAGNVMETMDALGNITTTLYDLTNRPYQFMDALGYITTTVYNIGGQVQKVLTPLPGGDYSNYYYDPMGRQVAEYRAKQSEPGYFYTTVYDVAGRVWATVDPLNHRTTTIYDVAGQARAMVDAKGHRTTTNYDAAGQVQSVQDARNYLTSFAYDMAGRMTTITNANGYSDVTHYDARGMARSTEDALGALTTYQYDAVGNLVKRTDALSRNTIYTVDVLDRLTTVLYASGQRVTHTYDIASRLLTLQDSSGMTSYAYDAADRMTQVASPHFGTTTYIPNAVGNPEWMRDPSGGWTYYAYDYANRLYEIVSPSGDRCRNTWNFLNQLTRRNLDNIHFPNAGSGLVISHTFDPGGRETLLTNRHPDARGGDAVAIYTSTYDAVGNRLTMQELDGSLVTYAYDQSYQLVHEERSGSYPYSISYEYDALGNRLTQNADGALTTYAYNEANQLVSLTYGSSLTTFTYDAKGNLKQESTGGNLTVYTWDDENRLTGIVYPDSARETYTYDAQSLRRQKESAAGTVRYLWDGANVLEETDETGLPQVRYLTAPDSYDVIAQQQGGVGSYNYVFDPSGNTRLLVKPEGLVVVSYAYTSFGVELDSGIPDTHYGGEYPTNTNNTFYGGEQSGIYSHTYYGGEYGSLGVGPSYNPFRFGGDVGYYRDSASRLYVQARHLNPAIGKWFSRDPIGFLLGDFNLYRYVFNNPVIAVDPEGLQGWRRAPWTAHEPGGPLHPPGEPESCSPLDTCEEIDAKMRILAYFLVGHARWDRAHQTNRHEPEIAQRSNQYIDCIRVRYQHIPPCQDPSKRHRRPDLRPLGKRARNILKRNPNPPMWKTVPASGPVPSPCPTPPPSRNRGRTSPSPGLRPGPVFIGVGAGLLAYLVWDGLKWAVAFYAAPPTAGGSLVLAAGTG